jgi:predicted acyltransferase
MAKSSSRLISLDIFRGLIFPINKPLWTSSYVLYSAGPAMKVLSVIYLIADVLKFKIWGTFFVVFGTNDLFTFAMAEIWTKLMLYEIKIHQAAKRLVFITGFTRRHVSLLPAI